METVQKPISEQSFSSISWQEEIKKKLFRNAMNREWNEVIETYAQHPWAHKAKITRSGDTALHIAISDGQVTIVEQLMEKILGKKENACDVLETGNELKNTPLHLAASLGNVKMCRLIAGFNSTLIGERNKDGETPFFQAVLNGKREAFSCLHDICGTDKGYSYCKKKNGETILHSAISGEHFHLAFKIIQLYPNLINAVTEDGATPLHLLACNPSAFRSGSYIRGFRGLITTVYLSMNAKTWTQSTICHKARNMKPKQQIRRSKNENKGMTDEENPKGKQPDTNHGRSHLPPNYVTCFNVIKLISKSMLVILGLGSHDIVKLREKKKSTFGVISQPVDDQTSQTSDGVDRKNGTNGNGNKKKMQEIEKGETALLVAAKNGVVEMVEKIIKLFPVAINDMNTSKKNIVVLAVENRQPRVYRFLLEKTTMKETIFQKVDVHGNSALHLAAKLGDRRPWLIPGSALQMQWEIKWYEFVKKSMPLHFFVRQNEENKTAREIFTESHNELVKSGVEWLSNTSKSCSVVAALIATVAFATSTNFPGSFKEENNKPTLANEPVFTAFSIASLVALYFSVTSLVMFLAILTSRYQEKDFAKDLPTKLLVGLTTLFVSIASILVSFCAGHFFVLKDELKYFSFLVYGITCLPVTFFAIAQFPLYFDLIRAIVRKVPQRSYK
ncbi:unnamed protein product [Fraxinus pennsylvanica]|uniref:PGG domain-containing protein n=1 Tax=Fraxinus pennsylvanica TaxID=56036 RepID=A0AAD2A4A6_9LAMI|nr:unnamed protein product [Fraxinus pennsylvanica]